MKKIVPQGESKLVNGLWYNQGDEYEEDAKQAEPVEQKKKQPEKKEEG